MRMKCVVDGQFHVKVFPAHHPSDVEQVELLRKATDSMKRNGNPMSQKLRDRIAPKHCYAAGYQYSVSIPGPSAFKTYPETNFLSTGPRREICCRPACSKSTARRELLPCAFKLGGLTACLNRCTPHAGAVAYLCQS